MRRRKLISLQSGGGDAIIMPGTNQHIGRTAEVKRRRAGDWIARWFELGLAKSALLQDLRSWHCYNKWPSGVGQAIDSQQQGRES